MNRPTTWIVGLALLLCGCGPVLRPDPNPYAITSNVPTAEVIACGSRVIGLKACGIVRGQPLATLDLRIQGYNTGTVRVSSDKCGVEFDVRYSGHAPIEVPLSGLAQENCLLAISVQPEFPQEKKNAIVIGALKAFVRVRVLDQDQVWEGFESKVAENGDTSIDVNSASGKLMVRGCDAQIEEAVQSVDGKVKVPLAKLPKQGVKSCVYEGVVTSELGSVFFTWMVWRHAKDYVPAIVPSVSFDGKRIIIQADPATSVVSVDGEYHLTNALSMKFDRKKAHVVRTLTVGGRNVFGEYDQKRGFQWQK